jgi:membrane protease YdiL (CAAX protease family)
MAGQPAVVWRRALHYSAAPACAALSLTLLDSKVYTPAVQIAGFAIGLAAGCFEELVWIGFAMPRMRARLRRLAAGLLLGVI